MGKIISLGKIDSVFLFIIGFYIYLYILDCEIQDSIEEQEKNNNILRNELTCTFLIQFQKLFFLIPEFIRKKNSTINSTHSKNKLTIKTYVQIGFVSILWLINIILTIVITIENRYEFYSLLDANLLFLFIISFFLFKNNYHYHQYLSFTILFFISIVKNVSYIYAYNPDFNIKDKYYRHFLLIINSIIFSIAFGYTKVFLDEYNFSPYKINYLFAFIDGIPVIVLCFISAYIPCNNKFNKYCLVNDEKDSYFDNFKIFFNKDLLQIMSVMLSMFFHAIFDLLIMTLIQKYTLFHYILPMKILNFISTIESLILGKIEFRLMLFIIDIIAQLLDIFFLLVFIECIELNFCGLNKNLKKNIMERAKEDAIGEIYDGKNKKYLINDQYIVENPLLEEENIEEEENIKNSEKEEKEEKIPLNDLEKNE